MRERASHGLRSSRRTRLSAVAVAIAVVLMLAACGGGANDEDRDDRASNPASRYLPDGPVWGVRIAAGVDERGTPLEPAFTFLPTASEVTAVVSLGAVPAGATLIVEWRSIDGPGATTPLFAHRIPVTSFHHAYSVGVSQGRLAAGWYEVTASLGDHDVTALWRVRETEPATDVASISALASSRLPASLAADVDPEPPSSGESGDLDPWGPGLDPNAPCTGVSKPYGAFLVVIIEAGASGESLGGISGLGGNCGRITLAASVEGASVVVGEGDGAAGASFDPCELPGGSDMPGTVVRLEAWRAGHEQEVARGEVELVDGNVDGPGILFQSRPEGGSKVEPGDTILLDAFAVEIGPAPGIRSIEITSADGVVDRKNFGSEPTPCDWTRNFRFLEASYVVPEDPPPVIELRAFADDFVGRDHTEVLTFVTDNIWTGTLEFDVEQPVLAGVQLAHATVTFRVKQEDGGRLTGTAEGTQTQTLRLSNCPSSTTTPGRVSGKVTGTVEGGSMRLTVSDVASTPPVVTPCPEGPPGMIGNVFEFPQTRSVLQRLQRSDDGAFRTQHSEEVPGAYPYRLSYALELRPGTDS